ncbi:UDP-glucuronosyltransferase 2B37-like [Copidosoma floridanum]|uniref:UDP-glucuronosyltransferase 2B37-like n=1 Tax=Copidosoma floridanum TaxID=29053 RepID=UPI0006C9B173|nr:UDP-glucuronosyltransferase 2B37-like [Copidosoma floridanum]
MQLRLPAKPTWKLVVLAILLSGVPKSSCLRILAIFPLPSKSHFIQAEPLMRGLATRGHQVDVYSHFPTKRSPANYTDYSLAGSLPSLVNSLTYDWCAGDSIGISIPDLMSITGPPVCNLLQLPVFQKLINDPPTDPPYDLVIVEVFTFNCYFAFGRHLGVPVIGVSTMSLIEWQHGPLGNPPELAALGSILSHNPLPATFAERLYNVYASAYYSWVFDRLTRRDQDAIMRKFFGPDCPSGVDLQRDLALVFVNHHHVLNGPRPLVPAVVPIAGAHIANNADQLTPEVQQFLDDSEHGFVYVSFGSVIKIESFPKRLMDAFYGTFKEIAPVRVIMKVFRPEELAPGLPPNVITQKWLPQVQVLKHRNIKAFVTHGGIMGVQEAVYHGVPMVGFPMYGDQYYNIKSCAKQKMAIQLSHKDVTETVFTKAITAILQDPNFKKSAEKLRDSFRDAPMSPVNTAIYWVEYVARHGKDTLRSPIVHMPWWQASLLDVYAFIALMLLVVLYVAKVSLQLFVKIILFKKFKQSSGRKEKLN